MPNNSTIPEWLKESIEKKNLDEQLRDIIGRYRAKPNYSMGEYGMNQIIGFMQPFLMGLADQARKYYVNRIESWLNWYLDEFITEKSIHPIRKGKCACWSCELSRLVEGMKHGK